MSQQIEDVPTIAFTDKWYNIMHYKNSTLCSLLLTDA